MVGLSVVSGNLFLDNWRGCCFVKNQDRGLRIYGLGVLVVVLSSCRPVGTYNLSLAVLISTGPSGPPLSS